MNFSLEFTMTAADMRESATLHRSRRFSLIRTIAAVALVLQGLLHWFTRGLDWMVGLYLALTIYFVFSDFIFRWLFPIFFLRHMKSPLTFRVSIDDQMFSIQQDALQQEVLWSSLATAGWARENEKHFWFECGHHGIWIPKRAFPSANDMSAFRAFVKEKMGERCQFTETPAPLD